MSAGLKLLLIEDEPLVARFVSKRLRASGHEVDTTGDGESGLELAGRNHYSVVILDIGLSGELDGFDVARQLRGRGDDVPIMMLTARGASADIVKGLDIGADDYVTKPFNYHEFEARVRAMARRSEAAGSDVVRFGPLELDPLRESVLRDGEPLSLTDTEFRLLQELVGGAPEPVSREHLLGAVWGIDFDPQTRVVDVHVTNLRKKLEAGGYPRLIQTERGVGFRAVRDPVDGATAES